MRNSAKTSEFKERESQAKRQLLHRKYVSLIYNGFQNRTTEDLTEESDLFSNYRIDMEIDDPVTKMSS